MMNDGTLKRPRKRCRRDNCRFLLTSSSTWVLDEVIPSTSASLLVSYNNTIQFEQTLIKEELDTKNIEAVSLGTFVLPKDAGYKSAKQVDEGAEAEGALYIKFEEDCDKRNEAGHKGKDSLIDAEVEAESIGSGLEDKGKGNTNKDTEEILTVGKSSSSVYGRIKTVDGEVFYECEFCTKLFKVRGHVAAHRRSHTKEKIFKCDKCTKSYAFISSLNRHINTIHAKDEFAAKCMNGKFECGKCFKTCNSLKTLKDHTCKMFKCDKCNEAYSTLETLKRHTCGTFKCDMCNKAYITLHSLKWHMNNKCKPPEQVSRCEKCEKVFDNERRLLRHVKFECYYTALEALKTSKLGAQKASK